MKRVVLFVVLVVAGFAGGILWMKQRAVATAPASEHVDAKAPEEKTPAAAQLSRDTNGNAVVTIPEKTWQGLGIKVESLAGSKMAPEKKGYGQVLNPAALAALMTELATADAAYAASSNELARLKTLEAQGNASARALQSAEGTTRRDEVAIRATKDRLALAWGKAVSDQKDLPAFVQSLTSCDAVLVRIELLAGEALEKPPLGCRIVSLAGQTFEGEFLEVAPTMEAGQGRGFIFLVRENATQLSVGESVVGYLKLPGEPLAGCIVPRNAVVRAEGAGWVYVPDAAGTAFTRTRIDLSRPVETGWFVTGGVKAGERVITAGAQELLSFELKGASAEE